MGVPDCYHGPIVRLWGAGVKPYYQDDAVTIYHGDARDVLPQISADVLDFGEAA